MPPPETLSAQQARRIAIASQGFGRPAPKTAPSRRHLHQVLDRLGQLQIDSVSVLARAHYMPLFSRLGPYPMALLEAEAWGDRPSLFEYWAHEACLLPLAHHPLFRWRMAEAAAGENMYANLAEFGRAEKTYLAKILAEIRARGPCNAAVFEGEKGAGGWWGWSQAKRALEYLFWTGQVMTATRRGFQRLYDLPERVLPPAILHAPTPTKPEAQRALLRIAARALGVATEADLRDYFRLTPPDTAARIAELRESGDLIQLRVENWTKPAFAPPDLADAKPPRAAALLSPFDPLVWDRARTERIWGFKYRLAVYTPLEKRVHGYYVLPFLLGDQLVARVDLKADKAAQTLRVLAAHAEPGAPATTAPRLLSELQCLAAWLGLARVEIHPTGDFAPSLAACAGPHA